MRDQRRYREPGPSGRAGSGGVPDGLLLGIIGLGICVLLVTWTATGLAALLAHGSWPDGVTFGNTPPALRSLVSAPQDLPAAWPAAPAGALSGYGLFWGLAIGELMVLAVLGVFLVGTVARWKAVRATRSATSASLSTSVSAEGAEAASRATAPPPSTSAASSAAPPPAPFGAFPQPSSAADGPPPVVPPVPRPVAPPPVPKEPPRPAPMAPVAVPAVLPPPRAPRVLYGAPTVRRPAAVQAILDAEGPALVITSDPGVWAETKDTRAKLGPVLVYDPGHLCDTPARLHWSPTAGCENDDVAAARATALLAPVRPRALLDAAMADNAETLLRCWLHAAAIDNRPFKQVHRWAQGTGSQDAVRVLRTNPKATGGLAGLLEAALTAHPERREVAQQLVARALSALSSVHIRQACAPNRTDALTLESFADEGGTLYLVGESIEDPRSRPGAMPLLTALAADVVEHGRRMAARSSAGRLDPPMSLVLDDVAAVAPFPRLPELLSTGAEYGLPTLALLRSAEQARARWPEPLEH
ncbi:type IV secretory system conjugative DNA transfer family protein [Streptomyces clavuligerus]|uniref:Type IV secretory pathway n=1 Tax=Streptomyces clavuligerus TaxID=1901 RepID=B5GPA0_STRCL|nr:type IV secretory system conjugative DNA transfer family protein [Streptomyces clavuligerus]ANW19053.1 type VI secretion protein [Streptomyces clavuligerus]AXU13635.1 type VI secretion protein [Streptomyces clavuligerus]EDY48146.1 type IV secretory pathway [Streptomyces clavuligerus]EFG08222.1 Type IV secretory pathway [Streptomyces clavuligerus]MBY6303600.1 type VI secretion protein [Streptomyces clavuligerus]